MALSAIYDERIIDNTSNELCAVLIKPTLSQVQLDSRLFDLSRAASASAWSPRIKDCRRMLMEMATTTKTKKAAKIRAFVEAACFELP
jgi:hypothetical protein